MKGNSWSYANFADIFCDNLLPVVKVQESCSLGSPYRPKQYFINIMSASALKPDHSPTSDEIPKDLNLERYLKYPDAEVYYDPRPRIRNIVKELQDEHGWSWPPEPPKDWDKVHNDFCSFNNWKARA